MRRSACYLAIFVTAWTQAHGFSLPSIPRRLSRTTGAWVVSPVADPLPSPALPVPLWPCNDELDKKITKLAAPAVLNLLILPLVGIIDMMWVGRMNQALAIAGMQAANQVFSSSFWIISFLPTVVAPLIAKAAASGDEEAIQDEVAQAVVLGTVVGLAGMALLQCAPMCVLDMVLPRSAPALEFAAPYMRMRALSFVPALLSTIRALLAPGGTLLLASREQRLDVRVLDMVPVGVRCK